MNKLIGLALVVTSSLAWAKAPSFIGGEIHTTQTMGYGKYSITVKPSTGVGSITGFFPLCYADVNFTKCILWTESDRNHLEFDVEFTPTGDQYILTKPWIHTCLSDDNCDTKAPSTEPRIDKALQAVSFNSYPQNNQVYHGTGEINPYTSFNNYSIEILPNKITWFFNGSKILTREKNATNPIRMMPPTYWDDFNNLLTNKNINLVVNLWDGSQGGNGGFGGSGDITQTPGTAEITRIAYHPANCNGDTCTIDDQASFLVDFDNGQYILNGKTQSTQDFCGTLFDSFFNKITRTEYPVYVQPTNVTCENNKIILHYGPGSN